MSLPLRPVLGFSTVCPVGLGDTVNHLITDTLIFHCLLLLLTGQSCPQQLMSGKESIYQQNFAETILFHAPVSLEVMPINLSSCEHARRSAGTHNGGETHSNREVLLKVDPTDVMHCERLLVCGLHNETRLQGSLSTVRQEGWLTDNQWQLTRQANSSQS